MAVSSFLRELVWQWGAGVGSGVRPCAAGGREVMRRCSCENIPFEVGDGVKVYSENFFSALHDVDKDKRGRTSIYGKAVLLIHNFNLHVDCGPASRPQRTPDDEIETARAAAPARLPTRVEHGRLRAALLCNPCCNDAIAHASPRQAVARSRPGVVAPRWPDSGPERCICVSPRAHARSSSLWLSRLAGPRL